MLNTFIPQILISFSLIIPATHVSAQGAVPGSGQDSESPGVNAQASEPDSLPRGIQAILLENSKAKDPYIDYMGSGSDSRDYYEDLLGKELSVFTFDDRSQAMFVDQATLKSSAHLIDPGGHNRMWDREDEIVVYEKFEYQKKPMYFDKEGYVYTQDKRRWVKTPFVFMKSMMKGMFKLTNGLFPHLELPDGSVTYYGMDVSPDNYPILEWAFRYKVHYFEAVEELEKEFIDCGREGACLKYTLTSGKDKGSYVLFDNWGRLSEIFSVNSGRIIYTYGDYTVKLPNAKLVGQF